MLIFVLVLMLVLMCAQAVYTVYKATVNPRRTVLTWSAWDLWLLLPYGAFIWAVLAVLNGARP